MASKNGETTFSTMTKHDNQQHKHSYMRMYASGRVQLWYLQLWTLLLWYMWLWYPLL